MNRAVSTPGLSYVGRQDTAVSSGEAAVGPSLARPRRRRRSGRSEDLNLDDSGHSCKSMEMDIETSVQSDGRWDEHPRSASPRHFRPTLRSTRSYNTTPSHPQRTKLNSFSHDAPYTPYRSSSASQRQQQQQQLRSSSSARSLRSRRKSPHLLRGTRGDLNDSFSEPPLYSKDDANSNKTQISYAQDEGEVVSPYRYRGIRTPYLYFMDMNLSMEQMITLMFVFMIVCFLAGSHQLSMSVHNEIEDVTLNENILLFHLRNVEQHSAKFANTMRQLQEIHDGSSLEKVKQPEPDINTDILEHQIAQLREVEDRLTHEVEGLQEHVQNSAKIALQNHYGVGGVHIFLQVILDTGEGFPQTHTVGIQLWKETPHAAWSFLQQLTNGVWDGATIAKQDGRVLLATPKGGVEEMQPQVTFVEKGLGKRTNKRFTVSLTSRGLEFHLQDNYGYYSSDVEAFSIGSVVTDNFMMLKNMVRDAGSGTVKIVKGSASGAGF